MADRLDLVYRVLDLQVVDVDGRRCGRVDDVELEGDPPTRAVALIVGRGAHPRRLPHGWLARAARRIVGPEVAGGNVTRVPWEEIAELEARIVLRRPARELGLGAGDDELAPVVGRLLLARRPR